MKSLAFKRDLKKIHLVFCHFCDTLATDATALDSSAPCHLPGNVVYSPNRRLRFSVSPPGVYAQPGQHWRITQHRRVKSAFDARAPKRRDWALLFLSSKRREYTTLPGNTR
jgi:hypothetical protein